MIDLSRKRTVHLDRKYVWGDAKVKKPLNTVSTQTQSRISSSRLSKSADSRLAQHSTASEHDRPISHQIKSALSQQGSERQDSRASNKADIVLQSIESSVQLLNKHKMTESEEQSGHINENSNDSQEV